MEETESHSWILKHVRDRNIFWQCQDCNLVYKGKRTDAGVYNMVIDPPVCEEPCQ